MSMRKDLGRSRALRPTAESLEMRQLLSATVSGTDTAGDKWTLTLLGKGSLQVVKQDDPTTGEPGALDSATEINSITVAGTDPRSSRLIGKVVPAAGSSGQVFFNTLKEIPNHSNLLDVGLGLLAVNMPDFYLGYTGSTMAASGSPVAEISIPDGVNSLRFGGVDTTKFFGTTPADSPSQDNQNDEYLINLGIPYAVGTSIVVNSIISNTQPGVTASGSTTPGAPTQKSVVFQVGGRINLFEANEIDGNVTNAAAAAGFTGGTIVSSITDPITAITGEARDRPDRRQCHQILARHEQHAGQPLPRRRDQQCRGPHAQRLAQLLLRQGVGHHHDPDPLDREPVREPGCDRFERHQRADDRQLLGRR